MDLININIYFFFRFQRLSYVVDSLFVVLRVLDDCGWKQNKRNKIKESLLVFFLFFLASNQSQRADSELFHRSIIGAIEKKKKGSRLDDMQKYANLAAWRRRMKTSSSGSQWILRGTRSAPISTHSQNATKKKNFFVEFKKKNENKKKQRRRAVDAVWARRESRRPWLVAYRSSFFFYRQKSPRFHDRRRHRRTKRNRR